MKRPVLSDREKAAFGPRTLKAPGSPEWCWQTLNGLVWDYKMIDERYREVEKTIAELSEVQAWNVIPAGRPYGSLDALLRAEIGASEQDTRIEIAKRVAKVKAIDAKDRANVRPVGTTQRPDIHARVMRGEITPHAGMIEAGFRKPPKRRKLSARDPVDRAMMYVQRMKKDDVKRFMQRLRDEGYIR